MTRVEENQITIDNMLKISKEKPTGTYEELVIFQLGAIAIMLTDIPKVLRFLRVRQKVRIRNENN